jgi:hypothetical protein
MLFSAEFEVPGVMYSTDRDMAGLGELRTNIESGAAV